MTTRAVTTRRATTRPLTTRRQVLAYLVLVYAAELALALTFRHAHIVVLLSVLVPVTGALAVTAVTPRELRPWSLGLRTAGLRSWPVAVAVPVGFLIGAYGVALLLGVGTLSGPAPDPADLVVSLVVVTVVILGEEIGWRGFLLPRLQDLLGDRRRAAVATGFLHGLFHLPLIVLTTTYDTDGSRWVVAPSVVAVVTAAGVFYAWLRDRSGSVWPAAVAHNTANTVFDVGAVAVTGSPVALAYTAGESGFATLAVVAAFAVLLLTRSRVWTPEPVRASS